MRSGRLPWRAGLNPLPSPFVQRVPLMSEEPNACSVPPLQTGVDAPPSLMVASLMVVLNGVVTAEFPALERGAWLRQELLACYRRGRVMVEAHGAERAAELAADLLRRRLSGGPGRTPGERP